MKKLKIAVFFLVLLLVIVNVSVVAAADNPTAYVTEITKPGYEYVLASLNGGNFGESKSQKELAFMARMFRNADIIVLQEVSTSPAGSDAVARFCGELNWTGSKWNFKVSDPTHESGNKEKFAFLWKTSRVEAIPEEAVLLKSFKNSLEREPAKINFRINGKIVTVITFHLVPTKKKPEREVKAIGNNPSEFSGDYMIMSGDFNLGHKKLNLIFEKKLKLKHRIEGKTSLKNKPDKKNKYYANEYDNIYTKGIRVSRSAIVDFVPYFPSLKSAKEISDHLPVVIYFVPADQ